MDHTRTEYSSWTYDAEKSKVPNHSVEESAGYFSQATFLWAYPFLRAAYRKVQSGSLPLSSLPPPHTCDDPRLVASKLKALIDEEFLRPQPSIHRAFWRFTRPVFWSQLFVVVLYTALFACSTLPLRLSVRAMRGDEDQIWGYVGVAAMTAMGAFGGLLQQFSFHATARLGRQVYTAVAQNLFDKPARLDASSFAKHFTEGDIISMIGQDLSMFPYMAPFFSTFMATPFLILFPAALIFSFLGRAFLAGFAVCIAIFWCSSLAANAYKRNVAQKMKAADKRILLMNEALQGIRSVKLCAWEAAIERRVAAVRLEEEKWLLRSHLCYAFQQGIVAMLPVAVAVSTFVVHAALGGELETETVLMTLGCFEVLSMGFLLLPNAIMHCKTFSLSVGRFGRLLMLEDSYTPPSTTLGPGVQLGIVLEKASFRWSLDAPKPSLSDISLRVASGELVTVVGRVASGKTTLASAVFGLLRCEGGSVCTSGRCAYVPQSPQILNASVRTNILFGTPLDEKRYAQALRSCCLEPDLKQLTEGDLTEIGEKGITISGGQRARVALARAHAADAEVIVLDDPLSAMDAHVGGRVFQECIMADMRGSGKAVLMFTNQVHFCASADRVLVLEDGRVAEEGTFRDLLAKGGLFAEFYAAAAAEKEDDEDQGGQHAAAEADQRDVALTKPEALAEETPRIDADAAATADQIEDTTHAQGETAGDAAVDPKGKETTFVMSKEVMIEGRIGVGEFLRIARAGESLCLGVVLVIVCALAPVLMYASNISLSSWTAAAQESSPLHCRTELVLYVSAGCFYGLLCCARVFSAAIYYTRVASKLHARMVGAILRQTMAWYDTTPLGRVLNRCSQDVALMDLQLPRLFEFYMQHLGVVLAGIVGGAILVWPSLLLVIPLGLCLRIVFVQYSSVALDLQRLMLVCTSPLMSQMSSFLTAMDTIRAFGKADYFREEFAKSVADFGRVYYWIHAIDRVVMTVLVAIFVPVLTLSLGTGTLLLSSSGVVSADLGGLALAVASGLSSRIPLFMWVSATLEKFFGGAQRVAEYADLRWEGKAADHLMWESERRPEQKVVEEPWTAEGSLELVDVRLRYQPGLPLVLKGLSLAVVPGERLGVCGRTGSGKSTLFLAFFRMVEAESGKVIVDGRDASSVPLPLLRARLAIVPQDPLMFSGTVRSNLDFHGRHSEEELRAAVRHARLEDQIGSFPAGLDEPVQEKGSNFSAGTVQLLCIARILLGRRRTVFLDECTANVDYDTDAQVQAAMKEALTGCTVVCIAHRIHTIIDYEQVACLSSGRCAEKASPDELLRRPGSIFASLVDSTGPASAAELRQRAAVAEAARGLTSAAELERGGPPREITEIVSI